MALRQGTGEGWFADWGLEDGRGPKDGRENVGFVGVNEDGVVLFIQMSV